MKKLFTALICAIMVLGIGGCGNSDDAKKDTDKKVSNKQETASSDDAFLKDFKKGLENRWKIVGSGFGNALDDNAEFIKLLDCELKEISKYKDSKFEDEKLGKIAKKYIDVLSKQKQIMQSITEENYIEKTNEYSSYSHERNISIAYFSEVYKVTVKSNHPSEFYNMVADGRVDAFKDEYKHYGAGTYKVGEDIPVGTYVVFANNTSEMNCGVTIQNTKSASSQTDVKYEDHYIGNSLFNIYVAVQKDDYLILSNTTAFPVSKYPKLNTNISGEFMVGKDIESGTYNIAVASNPNLIQLTGNPTGNANVYSAPHGTMDEHGNDNWLFGISTEEGKSVEVYDNQILSLTDAIIKH